MAYDPGSRIGPYEIIGLLGAGGMGEVYRGRDPRLGRDVAVKVLTGEFAADSDRLRRFEAEARAAAALSHPNILAVYDVGSEGGVPYLVSEFLEGQTLRTALDIGPIPFRRVLDIARQISSGLTAAHTRGITHRDIKPDNIFITLDGRVKILDFGVAKRTGPLEPADGHAPTVASNTLTAAGMVVGTVGYMSPEQATGREVDYRCDQFAFGILIYEMLSGRRAFARDTHVEELAAIIRDESAAACRSAAGSAAAAAMAAQPLPGQEPGRALRVHARPAPRPRDAGDPHSSVAVADARESAGGHDAADGGDAAHRARHRRGQGEADRAARLGPARDVHRPWRHRQDAPGPAGRPRAEGTVHRRRALREPGDDRRPEPRPAGGGTGLRRPFLGTVAAARCDRRAPAAERQADAAAARQLRAPAGRRAVRGGSAEDRRAAQDPGHEPRAAAPVERARGAGGAAAAARRASGRRRSNHWRRTRPWCCSSSAHRPRSRPSR